MVARVAVRSINDGGSNQTADVAVYAGVDRTGVEVAQPYGFASVSPGGGMGLAFANGADQGDLVLLPIGNPAYRLGNLKPGEVAMYGQDGSRVHVKEDGEIEATSSKKLLLHVNAMTVEVDKDADLLRVRHGEGADAPRLTVRPNYVKMAFKGRAIIITDAGIFSTEPIIIGPDPEPDK